MALSLESQVSAGCRQRACAVNPCVLSRACCRRVCRHRRRRGRGLQTNASPADERQQHDQMKQTGCALFCALWTAVVRRSTSLLSCAARCRPLFPHSRNDGGRGARLCCSVPSERRSARDRRRLHGRAVTAVAGLRRSSRIALSKPGLGSAHASRQPAGGGGVDQSDRTSRAHACTSALAVPLFPEARSLSASAAVAGLLCPQTSPRRRMSHHRTAARMAAAATATTEVRSPRSAASTAPAPAGPAAAAKLDAAVSAAASILPSSPTAHIHSGVASPTMSRALSEAGSGSSGTQRSSALSSVSRSNRQRYASTAAQLAAQSPERAGSVLTLVSAF